jgi:hypothetical protein
MKLNPKLAITIMVCISSITFGQMPHDAIYMPKKSLCIAAIGTQSTWNSYWEGSLKRDNLNIGTHTTQSANIMMAFGINNKLNIIASLPYITTNASAGNLMGQKGVQDLSAWIKYKILDKKRLNINGVLGASTPIGTYVPDFMPMSIGLQSKSITGRIVANYQLANGLYLLGHASYSYRSTIKIDRDAYQADNKIYNSNIVNVPNTTDARVSFGYYKSGIQVESFLENFACVSGDNIRRNDMPFPTNNMHSTIFGLYAKYQPKNIGLNARYAFTQSGTNVGDATSYSVGILYQFKAKRASK